ncbi:MAG: 50S ribosomal protein L23 [Thermoguttaceae bacterium]
MPKSKDITLVNLALEPYQIVLRPLVTEKGYREAEHLNTYYFEVHALASKKQIKEAIEFLFEVKVEAVRTQHKVGKKRRNKRGYTQQRSWKKAVVKLHPDSKISYF